MILSSYQQYLGVVNTLARSEPLFLARFAENLLAIPGNAREPTCVTKRPKPTPPPGKKRDKTPPSKPTAAARRAALVRILAETLLEEMIRGTLPPPGVPETP